VVGLCHTPVVAVKPWAALWTGLAGWVGDIQVYGLLVVVESLIVGWGSRAANAGCGGGGTLVKLIVWSLGRCSHMFVPKEAVSTGGFRCLLQCVPLLAGQVACVALRVGCLYCVFAYLLRCVWMDC
jgi:hypothetical protein